MWQRGRVREHVAERESERACGRKGESECVAERERASV